MSVDAATDARWIQRAIDLARNGWGQVAPNPMVGAVVVAGDAVVGEGWHERWGGAHAEVVALDAAGARARGATLYVTLEPCTHEGKTPPCVRAVIAAGIARVVVATRDTNPIATGGVEALQAVGITVQVGTGNEAARELNASYFHGLGASRPWVTLKMAVTLDAAIADGTHTTSRVTGAAARHYAHHLRAGHDAVAVGMATVRADDPQLTVREAPAPRVPPARVVFSRGGRLSLASTLANSIKQGRVIVTCQEIDPEYEHALTACGVQVVTAPDLGTILGKLHGLGIRSLLVEGGASIAGAMWEAQLVDRLVLVQAPTVFGAGALGAFNAFPPRRAADAPRWRVVRRDVLDADIATTYDVRGS